MKIACLGWGSLIWKPGILPVRRPWRRDGPDLPIDFAREGDGGELAAVLCDSAPVARVMWALLDVRCVEAARELLRRREQIPSSQPRSVGSVEGCANRYEYSAVIARWARAMRLDAVVWTALPPRIFGENGRAPTIEEALAHIRELPEERRRHAEFYTRSAPMFIATPMRRALEETFGWWPNDNAVPNLRTRLGAPQPGSSRRRVEQ